MVTLDKIREQIKEKVCMYCGRDLDVNNIESYDYEGGWTVDGFLCKQWLYITCGCGYQLALWKLGVPRE